MMRGLAALLILGGVGCGRYADFTLPRADGPPAKVEFSWVTEAAPVITRGAPGEWDASDVLNPSVVSRGGRYYNLYSGFDGKTWHTGLAVSPDGAHWEKQGRVLSPDPGTWEGGYISANGHASWDGNEFLYWYQAGNPPRIGLARSSDATHWTKMPRPVVELGPYGSWDERGVADPYVVRTADAWYLYYLGQDRAGRQRLGVARSADGVTWVKLRGNPILELGLYGAFDEKGLGEPAVWASDGWWWMLYTGRDWQENRRIGLARSSDGVRWESLSQVFSGSEPWMSKVICDPTVEVLSNEVRVWFGGGNVARPDERLNGQIGLARLVIRRK